MAKIGNQSGLTLGTNLFLHIADKGGTDIAIDATGGTITSSTTNFTASSTSGGIVNRAIAVGDILTVSNTAEATNEGFQATVTAVSANSISFTTSDSPTDEAAGNDINLVAFLKTIEFQEAGGLSFVDGVSGSALHSELITLWHDSDLDVYAPPTTSIEPRAKSLALINGWALHNANTINAIRDSALEVRDTATSAARLIYGLLISGDLNESTDQMNFWPDSDAEMDAPTAAVMTGYINQLILLVDTANSVDDRGTWYVRCAEPGKQILYETVNAQFAEIYTVGNNNPVDPKLADPGTGTPFVSDGTIAAGGIYADILYYEDADSVYAGSVDGTNYNFVGYVDADGQTNEAVHAKINYLWRQSTDINSDGTGPSRRGDKQPPLTTFSGDLFTVIGYLLNFNGAQRNNLRLVDTGGTTRSWPPVNTITVSAPAIAHGGTFSVFIASSHGTATATVIQDESEVDQRDITIAAAVNIAYVYQGSPVDVIVAFSRPGFIESGLTDQVFTLSGNDLAIALSPRPDPSYVAAV
jgi:hypothetical protein